MKSAFLLFVMTALLSTSLSAQELVAFDQISPFHDGMAAVQKDGHWGFIDTQGNLVINFRDDLVADQMCQMDCCATNSDQTYPMFINGRALIKESKKGIVHYGYIDKDGKTVIPTDFLRAKPFTKHGAIVMRLYKDTIGQNEVIGKNMISYSYNLEVIDINGKVTLHLDGPTHMTYSKNRVEALPELVAKFLNEKLVSIRLADSWELRRFKNK